MNPSSCRNGLRSRALVVSGVEVPSGTGKDLDGYPSDFFGPWGTQVGCCAFGLGPGSSTGLRHLSKFVILEVLGGVVGCRVPGRQWFLAGGVGSHCRVGPSLFCAARFVLQRGPVLHGKVRGFPSTQRCRIRFVLAWNGFFQGLIRTVTVPFYPPTDPLVPS